MTMGGFWGAVLGGLVGTILGWFFGGVGWHVGAAAAAIGSCGLLIGEASGCYRFDTRHAARDWFDDVRGDWWVREPCRFYRFVRHVVLKVRRKFLVTSVR